MKRGNTQHGMCGTPTWSSWSRMIRRCTPGNDKAKWYADRGIVVCERWKKFENFFIDMGTRPKGKTLDRIDNNAGYSPVNCRWADTKTQGGNKRNNVVLTLNGKTQHVAAWARELGLQRTTIERRLGKGWPAEKALSTTMFHHEKGRRR